MVHRVVPGNDHRTTVPGSASIVAGGDATQAPPVTSASIVSTTRIRVVVPRMQTKLQCKPSPALELPTVFESTRLALPEER